MKANKKFWRNVKFNLGLIAFIGFVFYNEGVTGIATDKPVENKVIAWEDTESKVDPPVVIDVISNNLPIEIEEVEPIDIDQIIANHTTTLECRKLLRYDEVDRYRMMYGDEVVLEDGTITRCMRMTAYTWTGNPMKNGEYPYEGVCATRDCDLGKIAVIYDENFNLIDSFEIKDTGGHPSLKGGTSIDIYRDSRSECYEWVAKYGETVYVAFVDKEE